ncbi:uncharacterized protein [Apostichopus japonicus]|uniref:uncharacterized protein isoform X2 n=1 Tax=Stichopus japonicus TaxID=307972 RepID=UPI003AB5D6D7
MAFIAENWYCCCSHRTGSFASSIILLILSFISTTLYVVALFDVVIGHQDMYQDGFFTGESCLDCLLLYFTTHHYFNGEHFGFLHSYNIPNTNTARDKDNYRLSNHYCRTCCLFFQNYIPDSPNYF